MEENPYTTTARYAAAGALATGLMNKPSPRWGRARRLRTPLLAGAGLAAFGPSFKRMKDSDHERRETVKNVARGVAFGAGVSSLAYLTSGRSGHRNPADWSFRSGIAGDALLGLVQRPLVRRDTGE